MTTTVSRSHPQVHEARLGDPTYQAFTLLRVAFTVAPILFGLDKFANVMVDWSIYLAPWINAVSYTHLTLPTN